MCLNFGWSFFFLIKWVGLDCHFADVIVLIFEKKNVVSRFRLLSRSNFTFEFLSTLPKLHEDKKKPTILSIMVLVTRRVFHNKLNHSCFVIHNIFILFEQKLYKNSFSNEVRWKWNANESKNIFNWL